MFRVLPFVRFVFRLMSAVAVALVWALFKEPVFLFISLAAAVWFQFYLAGFRLWVKGDRLIRIGGNIFKRKTIYMLKTSCFIRTAVLHPDLPALVRIQFPGERAFLVGLSGRQAKLLEEILQKN